MQANYNYNNKSKEKGSCGEQGCVPVVRSVIKQAAQLLGCIGSKTQQWYHVEKQQHATTSSTPIPFRCNFPETKHGPGIFSAVSDNAANG